MSKVKKIEDAKIQKLMNLFNSRPGKHGDTTDMDRAEFEDLMLGEPMQNTLRLLGISVEEADEMFRICDYDKTETVPLGCK